MGFSRTPTDQRDLALTAGLFGRTFTAGQSFPREMEISTGAAPAAADASTSGWELTSGDAAGEHASIFHHSLENAATPPAAVLFGALIAGPDALGTANTDFPVIGLAVFTEPDAAQTDIAVFNPGAGDSTSGNIRVDADGTDTDGTIDYPSFGDIHYYEVVVDTADGETRFYVDASELAGNNPTATLEAVPTNVSGNNRAGVLGIVGANESTVTGYLSRYVIDPGLGIL